MKSDTVRLYVIAMLVLQAAATVALWVLDVLSVETTAAFEILLAANLVAFAVILEAYRSPDSIAGPPSRKASASATSSDEHR